MRAERIEPGPGQESVWDYPRPPRLELSASRIEVVLGGATIADSTSAYRVLETSSPPVFYLPPADVDRKALAASDHSTYCEWKGTASYYDVSGGGLTVRAGAWCYPTPATPFAAIAMYVAFYSGRMEACFVDGERVQAQAGDFYGGWITTKVVGPFKGEPGTLDW